jgi:hypothetical protein
MAFQLPNFNLLVNIWTNTLPPVFNPPRVADARANMAWGKRVSSMSTGGTSSVGVIAQTMTLLLESTTDIRGYLSTTGYDIVEVPSGSGRYYNVYIADYIGYGFPNQHKAALIYQRQPFKTPDT